MNDNPDADSELEQLPKGTIVRRSIRGIERFYHQWREDGVTKSRYLAPGEIMPLRAQLERRKLLQTTISKRSSGPVPSDFRCDVLTGGFLTEYTADAGSLKKRDAFAGLLDFIHGAHLDEARPSEIRPKILTGPDGVGKTTLMRQLIGALPPTIRAKCAYLRLTGAESPGDLTAGTNLLRNLGFKTLFIDDADSLAGLPGTGLMLILAAKSVPAALRGRVEPIDLAFISFCEYVRLTGDADISHIVEHGGRLGTDPLTEVDCMLNDRFVLDVLALAASRARSESRAHGEAFLGTDLQKLRGRFAEISGLTGEADEAARESLLDIPAHARFAHARDRISKLLEDPILDRLGAAERKIVRDMLMDETRLRLLEDIVWSELRHSRSQGSIHVHRIPFAPGVYGFVIADEDELMCEILTVTTDPVRKAEHLTYIDDPARLDVLEHRYGMVTMRTVLYNGRDAQFISGVSYRNLAKYLQKLGG